MGGGWSAPRSGRFTPGKGPVPIVQEAEWSLGPVWNGAENLAPPPYGIRSPDRPARSESLYLKKYLYGILCGSVGRADQYSVLLMTHTEWCKLSFYRVNKAKCPIPVGERSKAQVCS
jgi:hypothetical protein